MPARANARSCTDSMLLPRICDEKTAIQRQIEATDGQIDRLVVRMYGLAEEEIEIVEEASK